MDFHQRIQMLPYFVQMKIYDIVLYLRKPQTVLPLSLKYDIQSYGLLTPIYKKLQNNWQKNSIYFSNHERDKQIKQYWVNLAPPKRVQLFLIYV